MALEKWDFDTSHSSINFAVRHMVVSKVHGRFLKWSGDLQFAPDNLTQSKIEVEVDANSIETHDEKRDAHLKSADFLDSGKYPKMSFKSTRIEKAGDNEYNVVGNLTVHGVTKEIALKTEFGGRAKDPWGGERAGFTASTTINRKDFGLGWNVALEAGGWLVGEKVEISLEVEALKAKAA
jgi:polyisoprenoid-binding protein YceI